ncbi:MAG TPA: single-stranded-DNA-specific exonuclease RecJ [Gemmatimonadales bacterium]|nr:single-stranded-DNA-specific exonuclease RecJ [Gemmatimonadales bacterium]
MRDSAAAFPAPPLRWVVEPVADPAASRAIGLALGIPETLAGLLVQRGFTEPELARRFLRPALTDLADPLSLAGMAAAAEEVANAVRKGQTILVHGDYDVDGQCATALLTRALRTAGATVVPYVPHRLRDGYDFGPAGLAAARAAGAGLIVTCDCGITAVETVAAARAEGFRVVVSDHHLPGASLPDAHAVIDPQQPDDRSGLNMLCGTGVVFKLVQALVPLLDLPANLPFHLLDLAALATVADVVPLTGENRILVRHGLKLLGETRWEGLRALARVSGLADRDIRATHLGFVLGPRLNAAGRIGDAGDGLRLLLTDDAAEADRLARQLDSLNVQRQAMDQRILDDALAQVEREADPDTDLGLVLASDDWHPGVVGIVASRVVERYGRPTVLVAFEGEIGKGSGRSISRFNLHGALVECADLLERFGGHHMAAGVTVRRENLEAFRSRFAEVSRRSLRVEDLAPEQRIDVVLPLSQLTPEFERLCRHLEPCGMGNPGPVFGVRRAKLTRTRRVGSGHLKGVLEQDGERLELIGFQWWDRVPWLDHALAARAGVAVDAAFRLEQNEYQGVVSLQARLVALAPAGLNAQ